MTEDDIVEGEIVEEHAIEVAATGAQGSVNLFGARSPAETISRATEAANALKEVLVRQGLVKNISGKQYPNVEGWTLLGSMLGVFPVVVWTHQIDNGWEARVEARLSDGSVVGAAEAICVRSESAWARRDEYALRGMAQTRATSRALRGPLGFVMALAGFEALGDDEAPRESSGDRGQPEGGGNPPGGGGTPSAPGLRQQVLDAHGGPKLAVQAWCDAHPEQQVSGFSALNEDQLRWLVEHTA